MDHGTTVGMVPSPLGEDQPIAVSIPPVIYSFFGWGLFLVILMPERVAGKALTLSLMTLCPSDVPLSCGDTLPGYNKANPMHHSSAN
jgi:hypothetical protein